MQREDPHERVRRLRNRVEELALDIEIERAHKDSAERLRSRAGKVRADAIRRCASLTNDLATAERELAAAKTALPEGPATVTDRAIVRWLELCEGVDVGAVRRRILSAMRRTAPITEGDYQIHDVGDVRIVANREGKAFTIALHTENPMFVKESKAPVTSVMTKCGSCGTIHQDGPCPPAPAVSPAPRQEPRQEPRSR